MKRFRNILYVSHGNHDETDGLKQALSLARNNAAALRVLMVYPAFPKSHQEHAAPFETALGEHMQRAIESVQASLNLASVVIPVDVIGGRGLSDLIVQRVQDYGHDLVIKQAESREGGKGLMAIDMALLRRCPTPVWLSRPITRSGDQIQVAVAVDADTETDLDRELAINLLQLARSLADSCSGELCVIACWDYEYEEFLRNSAWSKVPEAELNGIVRDVEQRNRTNLEGLVAAAGITGTLNVQHVRGSAAALVPQRVTDCKADVLVMGTVARTGIAGYVIGNTAENVAQNVGCSLLVLKPGTLPA